MRSKWIPVQQAAAAEVTRPLPSLAEWGVATRDYEICMHWQIADKMFWQMCNSDLDMGWEWVWEVEGGLHHVYSILYVYVCTYIHVYVSSSHISLPHTSSHILMHLTHAPHIPLPHTTPLHTPPGSMVSSQERLWKSLGATLHLWTWLSSFLTHTTSYQPAVMGQWRYANDPLETWNRDCYHGTWWWAGTVTMVLGDGQGLTMVLGDGRGLLPWYLVETPGDGERLLPWQRAGAIVIA